MCAFIPKLSNLVYSTAVLVCGWVLFGMTLLVCVIVLVWMIIKQRSATKKNKYRYV